MRSWRSVRRATTSSLDGLEIGDCRAPIVRATVWLLRLRLARPVTTAQRTIRARQAALVRLEDGAGRFGIGEATPLVGFGRKRRGSLRRVLRAAAEDAVGLPCTGLLARLRGFPARDAFTAAVRFGFETAALDLVAQEQGLPLARVLFPRAAASVRVNALLGGETPDEVARSALDAVASGFGAAKLKVGGRPLRRELARVAAAREALGDRALRLDANGAWEEAEAEEILRRLEPFAPEYVEQPIPPGRPDVLARLRRRVPVPIAADEDAYSFEAVEALLDAGAVDVLVLKPAVVGGLLDCRRIARAAADAGVDSVVTSALDTTVAVAAAAPLAASLGRERAHGLATAALLARDVAQAPLAVCEGTLTLGAEPGLGVRLSEWVTTRQPYLEVTA